MTARVVTLIGAGNIRVAPITLAALAEFFPELPLTVSLFDANGERLDLMDRLARCLFDITRNDAVIKSSGELDEAVKDSTDIVLALNEDGARRMLGRRMSGAVVATDDSVEIGDVYSGDFNRPTPMSKLSEHTRLMLQVPDVAHGSREEVIRSAFDLVNEAIGQTAARRLNLTRGLSIDWEAWDWPAPLADAAKAGIPHQILRWINHDDEVGDLLSEARESRFRAWLEER